MVENGTLIEKIEKHPRIWCTVAAIITLICIAGGVFLFAVRPSFKASDIEKAPYFGHVKGEITEHFADEDFEIRNSFCRYIPTGNDYFYRICCYTKLFKRTVAGKRLYHIPTEWEHEYR